MDRVFIFLLIVFSHSIGTAQDSTDQFLIPIALPPEGSSNSHQQMFTCFKGLSEGLNIVKSQCRYGLVSPTTLPRREQILFTMDKELISVMEFQRSSSIDERNRRFKTIVYNNPYYNPNYHANGEAVDFRLRWKNDGTFECPPNRPDLQKPSQPASFRAATPTEINEFIKIMQQSLQSDFEDYLKGVFGPNQIMQYGREKIQKNLQPHLETIFCDCASVPEYKESIEKSMQKLRSLPLSIKTPLQEGMSKLSCTHTDL